MCCIANGHSGLTLRTRTPQTLKRLPGTGLTGLCKLTCLRQKSSLEHLQFIHFFHKHIKHVSWGGRRGNPRAYGIVTIKLKIKQKGKKKKKKKMLLSMFLMTRPCVTPLLLPLPPQHRPLKGRHSLLAYLTVQIIPTGYEQVPLQQRIWGKVHVSYELWSIYSLLDKLTVYKISYQTSGNGPGVVPQWLKSSP